MYSRTAVTVPEMGATMVPFHVLPELLMSVVMSLPVAVLNMNCTAGPFTVAGRTWVHRSSKRRTPIDKSAVRAGECRESGVVSITRPAPTALDVIKGAEPVVVANTVAVVKVTGL